jgi:hypothetical protein
LPPPSASGAQPPRRKNGAPSFLFESFKEGAPARSFKESWFNEKGPVFWTGPFSFWPLLRPIRFAVDA